MATEVDVYRDWLGIQETARPLNYYQLLRLKQFEDDPAKVRAHYAKMNAHVRKFASGDFAQQSQDLLNELARAMLCLTDRQRKSDYDAQFGRKEAGRRKRRTLEQLLIEREVATEEQVAKATRYADAVGLELRDAVVQQKFASQDVASQLYAESEGLPYVDLGDVGVDLELAPRLSAVTARQHSCVPLMATDGVLLMAAPKPLRPDVEDDLRLRFEMPVRTVVCTPAAINAAVNEHYPKSAAAAEMAANSGVAAAAPDLARAEGSVAESDAPAGEAGESQNLAVIAAGVVYVAAMVGSLLFLPSAYKIWTVPLSLVLAGAVYGVMKVLGK